MDLPPELEYPTIEFECPAHQTCPAAIKFEYRRHQVECPAISLQHINVQIQNVYNIILLKVESPVFAKATAIKSNPLVICCIRRTLTI